MFPISSFQLLKLSRPLTKAKIARRSTPDILTKSPPPAEKSKHILIATGADISRGWGIRRSVAADYLYDYPVQLGSIRVGPDLADVGARLDNANWQLLHLYAPQSVVKDSAMPPFRFLFETQKIGDDAFAGRLEFAERICAARRLRSRAEPEDAKNSWRIF